MKPESKSISLLGVTRSKAKMYEYDIPSEYHISISSDPARLLSLTIGIIGDYGQVTSIEESHDFIEEHKDKILFSAQYFDAYAESKLVPELSDYFLLIGSAAYYLSDFPGSAQVLAKRISNPISNLFAGGLEVLLLWVLQNDLSSSLDIPEGEYAKPIEFIFKRLINFYKFGNNYEEVIGSLKTLKNEVYFNGSDRELLFSDVIISIIKKQLFNSSWNSLKRYTSLDISLWKDVISKSNFIREFWPSQQLLGEHNVFKGKSAVIQMPTSAGKTKSTEIIIRSSFISGRSKMAVIVAPFRALCSEIKNDLQQAFQGEQISIDEPSDALQSDFDSIDYFDLGTNNLILIVTPEKLLYMLRSVPELAREVGLLIYDEGHQFDNGIRGVTYELLLSSLKKMVSKESQIILISAVISNASSIGDWLISNEKEIIEGHNLTPTYRTTAFISWQTQLGMLQFVSSSNPEVIDYFVPRVLNQQILELKGRERRERRFPEKNDGKGIALFLANRLVEKGAVAIFCGSKLTVKSIYETAVDIISRNYELASPLQASDAGEIEKLTYLLSLHFGSNSSIVQAAQTGIFTHSGHIPQGLRLATEYAMQVGKIKLIICTSTLAQGVNLPIKYLLITSFYQAGQKIKTRDFHNLIGRAGRSGIHTEGSIIFTDPELFDGKNNESQNWKWKLAKELLDPLNSEPCSSTLLSIFSPLVSDDRKYSIKVSPLEFVEAYLDSPDTIAKLAEDFSKEHADKNFTKNGLSFQIEYKIQIISAVESYLMASWENFSLDANDEALSSMATETLAYSISTSEEQEQIIEFFKLLGNNVKLKIDNPKKRLAYSRTLLGVQDILEIEKWLDENFDALLTAETQEEILSAIWPIIYKKNHSKLKQLTPESSSLLLLEDWIKGFSYNLIHEQLNLSNTKVIAGSQTRNLQQENLIDICEGSFSYDTSLVLATVVEMIFLIENTSGEKVDFLASNINSLQKRIKYGLPTEQAIAFYEIGFADRMIALDLSLKCSDFPVERKLLLSRIARSKDFIRKSLQIYPSYFTNVLDVLLNK